VTVDVRIERARATMLQLDDPDARDLLAEETTMAASRIELGPPREQDALTQPVLQLLELARELGMQQRRNAVRLRVIERPIEYQVRVRAQLCCPRSSPVIGSCPVSQTRRPLTVSWSVVMTRLSTMNRETVESDAAPYASSASAPVG
jgi:hypothetical protein